MRTKIAFGFVIGLCVMFFVSAWVWSCHPVIVYDFMMEHHKSLRKVLPESSVDWMVSKSLNRKWDRHFELGVQEVNRKAAKQR